LRRKGWKQQTSAEGLSLSVLQINTFPRRTIVIGEASAKTISRRPAAPTGNAQRGRGPYLFSRKNDEKMQSIFVSEYRNVVRKRRKGAKNARKSFIA
jgi:hypothetical protein